MTVSHTGCGVASISIEPLTMLIAGGETLTSWLARRQWFGGLPVAQRVLDRGIERVQPDSEQLGGGRIPREQVLLQALHERLDQRGILARDRGGDPAGDRRDRKSTRLNSS